MGKKDQPTGVDAVLQLLRKQSSPLTVNQEKFCNQACVERFLEAKGYNPKKTAKLLRACLSWRHSIGIEDLTADEFGAELAEGVAYVAGHDEESRPVTIFRMKQDYHKFHSQKLLIRLLVFTLEVAIGTMPKNVDQFILLFDASLYRSASAFMNVVMATLKIAAEYYPGRLRQAFLIDPPSMFSCLWKGVKPFVELSSVTFVVSSLDFQDMFSSLQFGPSSVKPAAKVGSCSSSRFSFTVSHHLDPLKPWHLSLTDDAKAVPTGPFSVSLGPALVSPLNARSLSFASPATNPRNALFPSTPLPQRVTARCDDASSVRCSRTPGPGFLQSPASFFGTRKGFRVSSRPERSQELFAPLVKLYRRPYDEMAYRSKMRPPLGGQISIVSPYLMRRRRRHVSASQRF